MEKKNELLSSASQDWPWPSLPDRSSGTEVLGTQSSYRLAFEHAGRESVEYLYRWYTSDLLIEDELLCALSTLRLLK